MRACRRSLIVLKEVRAMIDTDIKQLILNTAKYSRAKRSYAEYFLLANPSMKLYPHTKLITQKLQKIADGEQHFYIISMPPTAREESYNY